MIYDMLLLAIGVVLLIVIAIELGVMIYLQFKKLPVEQQKEILRKVEPVNSEVVEWTPPKDENQLAEEEVRRSMK